MQGNTQQEKFLSKVPTLVVVDKYGHRRRYTFEGFIASMKQRHERQERKRLAEEARS